ncbi:hypothetical protein BJX96DRAFT_150844 [Aspergillus floccosus]
MPQDIGFTMDRADSAASWVASEEGKIRSALRKLANRNISQKHVAVKRRIMATFSLHFTTFIVNPTLGFMTFR